MTPESLVHWQWVSLNIKFLAAVFFLVMFQGGLCHIAKTTGSLYSQMNPNQFWVGGGMVNQCD